jgi:hypothetical protein
VIRAVSRDILPKVEDSLFLEPGELRWGCGRRREEEHNLSCDLVELAIAEPL